MSKAVAKAPDSFVFTLEGINMLEIHRKYGLETKSSTGDKATGKKSTPITQLDGTPIEHTSNISFLDSAKIVHKCDVRALHLDGNIKHLRCNWCHHVLPEGCVPIGVPVAFSHKRAMKTYYSEISKDEYRISEAVDPATAPSTLPSKVSLKGTGCYITDGMTCSFNCARALIENNNHDSRYDRSMTLLWQMYYDFFKCLPQNIAAAPHWKQLSVYGGHLDIGTFRRELSTVSYSDMGEILSNICYAPKAHAFEKQYRF